MTTAAARWGVRQSHRVSNQESLQKNKTAGTATRATRVNVRADGVVNTAIYPLSVRLSPTVGQ